MCSIASGCIAPLGMENEQISDAQIRASSMADASTSPTQARLYLKADQNIPGGGAWCAEKNDAHQWIQVDLGSYTTITRVATQGRNGYREWVTKYKLQYGDDGAAFQVYQDLGNTFQKVIEVFCFRF